MVLQSKPAPVGIFGRGHLPPAELQPAYAGQWVQFAWADVEPAPGVYDWSVLDKQLALMPAGWQARLRPFAGSRAPDWLKHEVGTYSCQDAFLPGAQNVAVWWDPDFGAAYAAFISALAAHTGGMAHVIEVAATMTSSIFAEPFIRQMADSVTRTGMLKAGYTFTKDQDCVHRMLDIHNRRLPHARTGVNFNPWQNVTLERQDADSTVALINTARSQFGKRLILENASLDAAPGPLYKQLYAAFTAQGPPMGFQTRATVRLPDPTGAIQLGISYGATSLEPNPSDFVGGLAEAEKVRAQLEANVS